MLGFAAGAGVGSCEPIDAQGQALWVHIAWAW